MGIGLRNSAWRKKSARRNRAWSWRSAWWLRSLPKNILRIFGRSTSWFPIRKNIPKKYDLVGNNIAGITLNIPVDAQFKAYKTLVPGLKTIGVIYDANNSGELIREANAVAKKLGVELVAVSVQSQKEVPEALRGMLGKVDAVWMVPDETVVTTDSFKYFLLTTLENGVPFFAASDIFVEAGALAALTPDYTDVGRQGCQLAMGFTDGQVTLAEAGARPPRKVNLSLNLKTARKIGLAIPTSVIESAKLVYR